MSSAIALVFSVTGVVTAFALAALLLFVRPRSSVSRRIVIGIAVFYLLSSTYAVPHAVARLWNSGYGRFEARAPAGRSAIVLLGSGGNLVVGWDGQLAILTPVGTSRVLEAARVYRMLAPNAVIVSSGGRALPGDVGPPSSETMRTALIGLGVPAEHIVLESESRNTHDEAVLIAPMLRNWKIDDAVIVTSDVHMRRSIGAFVAAGFNAKAAIAPDPGAFARSRWWMPSDIGLQFTADLVHELVGLPYYWWHGWWRPA